MNRTTVTMLVVFAGLLVGVLYMQKKPDKGEGRKQERATVKVPSSEVDTIEIVRPGQPKVVLEKDPESAKEAAAQEKEAERAKKDGGTPPFSAKPLVRWKMVKPISYRVDPFAVRALTDKLSDLDLGELVSTNPERHAQYEVNDQKGILLTLSGGGKEKVKLIVGKATGANAMLRLAGKPEVYQGPNILRAMVDKDVKSWRDKVITEFPYADAAEVEIKTAAGSVVLERGKPEDKNTVGKRWLLKQSPVKLDKIDESQVINIVTSLSSFRTADFADGKTPEQAGLTQPRATVTVKLKDGKSITVHFGTREKDETYVQVEGQPQIFQIRNWNADRFVVTPKNLADKTLFSFDPDTVTSIHIKGVEPAEFEATHEGVNWRIGKPKFAVGDAEKLKSYARSFAKLQCASFEEDPKAATGLDKGYKEITVKTKDGKTHVLRIGHQLEPKSTGDYYAQVVGSHDVVRLRKFTAESLLKKASDLEQGAKPASAPPLPPDLKRGRAGLEQLMKAGAPGHR